MSRSNLGRFTHVHRHSLHEPWYAFISGGTVVGAWLSSVASNFWDASIINPDLGQNAQAPGSAPQNLTISAQVPDPSATNATNGTPGSVIVQLGTPVNGGSNPFFQVTLPNSSNPAFSVGIGPFSGAPAMWLSGQVAPPNGTDFIFSTTAALDAIFNCNAHQYFIYNGNISLCSIVLDPSNANTTFGGNATIAGGGQGVVGMTNAATIPTSTPSGGGVLYATAGALHWLGSSGHDATIAPADPYCPVCGLDVVSEHRWISGPNAGKYFSLCYNCLAEHLGNPAFVLRDATHRESRKGWRKPLRATHKHYAFAAVAATIATVISHFWR